MSKSEGAPIRHNKTISYRVPLSCGYSLGVFHVFAMHGQRSEKFSRRAIPWRKSLSERWDQKPTPAVHNTSATKGESPHHEALEERKFECLDCCLKALPPDRNHYTLSSTHGR